jgi:Protein of unknown function (DUF3592)
METLARLILVLMGTVFFFGFGRDFLRSLASREWVAVEGKIIRTWMSETTGSHHGNTFTPNVAYEYTYKGRKYQGSTIRVVGISYRYKSFAVEELAKFVKGSRVQVYLNPSHPTECALQPRAEWLALVFAVLGAVAATASTYFLVVA